MREIGFEEENHLHFNKLKTICMKTIVVMPTDSTHYFHHIFIYSKTFCIMYEKTTKSMKALFLQTFLMYHNLCWMID